MTRKEIDAFHEALTCARVQLVTLGGDPSGLVTRKEAVECGVDLVQWEVLRKVDRALSLI